MSQIKFQLDRHAQIENGATSVTRRAERSRTADFLHSLANNCESETGTTLPRGEERFPNAFTQVGRHARASVFNTDRQLAIGRTRDYFNLPAAWRRLQCVQQKIRDRIAHRGDTLSR